MTLSEGYRMKPYLKSILWYFGQSMRTLTRSTPCVRKKETA